MVSFLKNILSSCLGTVLGLGLILLILIGVGSAIGSLQSEVLVKNQSVLKLTLPEVIPERTNNLPMGFEFLKEENVWGIHELANAIKKAADDSKIEAIILQSNPSRSFVQMDILRQALHHFKASGKPVYAYGDYYGQTNLYLASKADKIYLNPLGMAELKGFAVVEPFMKDALDKLGVQMEVYYAGDFKSATEPFRSNSMSSENELQLREFITEMYDNFLDSLAVSRNLSKGELQRIANIYASRSAQDAKKLGLVDEVGYDSDLIRDLKIELGYDEDKRLNVIDLSSYRTHSGKDRNYFADEKIAVVYFEGELREGDKEEGSISAKRYVPILRKIAQDDNIKSVVLRINSPGGNAMTSDKILEEIRRLKLKGKTIIASLSDVAASGGYYIAAEADTIIASHQTVTGSIGVFAMFPNFSKMVEDKLLIHMDSVSTSPYAGMGNLLLERSPKEKEIFQQSTDSMYETFLSIVAKGRQMTRDEVHQVAQGRIWTGETAVKLGLVDLIGDLEDAISLAAQKGTLEDYRIVEYPISKSPIQQLAEEFGEMGDLDRQIDQQLEEHLPQVSTYRRLLGESRQVQAFMPYQLIFN